MQYPRFPLSSLASVTLPRCLAAPRSTFSMTLEFLSSSKALRAVGCVNNQRQQTPFPLQRQRQFSASANFDQNDNSPEVKAKKPFEEWSAQEIQSWLQQEGFARFAHAFVHLNGKALSHLTKDDLQKEFGNLDGSALYHAIKGLEIFSVESTFELIAKKNPSLDFKGPPQAPEDITLVKLDFMGRRHEVEELTKAFCADFLGFYLKSAHKKDKVLIAITGGSGVGKTRLSVTMLNLVREEVTQNAKLYLSHLNQLLMSRTTPVSAQEVYEALLSGFKDDSKAHTLYIDFSNGDYIPDWNNPKSMEKAFFFSLLAKAFFPQSKVRYIRAYLNGAEFDHCTTLPAVVSALHQRYGHGTAKKDRVTIVINIDEFQTKITNEDIRLLHTDPAGKDRILIRQIADCIMSACLQLAESNFHVVPVFSGTLSLAYVGVFPATHYTLHNLSIGPLSLEVSQKIVRSALNRDDIPNSLVGTVGGVARGLQYLVEAIHSQPNKTSWSHRDVFQATVKAIKNKYGITNFVLSANGVKTLVSLCLSGKEVKKGDQVDGISLGMLERDGVLFLRPSNPQNDDLFQVVMPLAFAAAFNERLELFDPNFVTYKPVVKSSVRPSPFPLKNRFLLLTCMLLMVTLARIWKYLQETLRSLKTTCC
ncbi:hypothetical protein QOT17_004764 [Balamuthia mandrillaris]